MKVRIQKVLANAGVASRRNIEQMVLEGRIAVNGRTVRELPVLVDPEADKIDVDGERMKLRAAESQRRYYFVLNKPKGVYSTNVAQGEQRRAIDLLPPNINARLYPVGRLDSESRGLLLLTNDGELTNELTHLRFGVPKTYRAAVDGYITPETLAALERGVWLADTEGEGFRTSRSHVRIVHRSRHESVLEISIREGRNREVRRMLARLGHKVRDLMRVKMGPLTLAGLAPGQFRELTQREIRELKTAAKKMGREKPRGRSARSSPPPAKQ